MVMRIAGATLAKRGKKKSNTTRKAILDLFKLKPYTTAMEDNEEEACLENYLFFDTPDGVPRDHTSTVWKKWAGEFSARATAAKTTAENLGHKFKVSRASSVEPHGVYLVCRVNDVPDSVANPVEEPEEIEVDEL